jgi:uncharacterized protein YndB with AHSA1/START domain
MANKLRVAAHGDRELVITREFNAPRELVFEAWITPELVRQWLGGMDGWEMTVCEIDAHPGGRYRYEWNQVGGGARMGMGGEFREVVAPEKLVMTEKFDDPWYEGGAVSTVVLTERAGKTLMQQTVRYDSREARDSVLKSPAEEGLVLSFDRLENLVAGRESP